MGEYLLLWNYIKLGNKDFTLRIRINYINYKSIYIKYL